MLQVAEYHQRSLVPVNSQKRPSQKARKQKLLAFLQGIHTTVILDELDINYFVHLAVYHQLG